MKLLREISLLLILSTLSLYSQEEDSVQHGSNKSSNIMNLSLIVFDSEKTTFYEDGVQRIKYPSYSIFSSDNKLIATIPSAFDTPYKVEIEADNYRIEFTSIEGETKSLKVKTSLNEISKLVK